MNDWSNFYYKLRNNLDYSAWKYGWGDIANWINSLLGTHLAAADVMLGALALSPFIFIAILTTAYLKVGPRLKDRPGATGRESSLTDIKGYTYPSRFMFYIVRWVPVTAGITALLYGVARVLNGAGLASAMPSSDMIGGLGTGIGTTMTILMFSYTESNMRKGRYILGYKQGKIGKTHIALPKEKRASHLLINGPTGGGKTTGYVEPQLISDAMADNISDFVIDVKPDEDLIDNVAAAWTAQGKKVVFINPWDPDSNFSINPLLECKGQINDQETYHKVSIIVDAIFKAHEAEVGVASADASYFETQERELLWGLIAALLEAPVEMRNLPTLYSLTKRPLIEMLAFIANLQAPFVMKEIQSFAGMNAKQQNDFLSGLRIKLAVFGMPGVSERFVNNDYNLDRFFKEPTLMVVKSPLDKPSSFKVATLLTRLMMMYHYNHAKQMKENGHYAFYFLDEFGSLRIPNVTNVATTIRSSNGGLVILLHDRADLLRQGMRRAGTASPESMDASLRTQVVIADSHQSTCEYYSRLMGNIPYVDQEKMRNVFNILAFNFRSVVREAPLMTADQIKYMEENESLIFLPNKRGIKIHQERVYANRHLKKFASMPYLVEEPLPTADRITSMQGIDESLFANDGDLAALCEILGKQKSDFDVYADVSGDTPVTGGGNAMPVVNQEQSPENQRTPTGQLPEYKDEGVPMFQHASQADLSELDAAVEEIN